MSPSFSHAGDVRSDAGKRVRAALRGLGQARLHLRTTPGFNDRTRRFAAKHGLPMIDLAREVDRCADCFYDQWHFNVEGARRAGGFIASELIDDGLIETGRN